MSHHPAQNWVRAAWIFGPAGFDFDLNFSGSMARSYAIYYVMASTAQESCHPSARENATQPSKKVDPDRSQKLLRSGSKNEPEPGPKTTTTQDQKLDQHLDQKLISPGARIETGPRSGNLCPRTTVTDAGSGG